MTVRRLSKVTLALPWEKYDPPAQNDRTSDEDVVGKYLHQVVELRARAGKTGGVPQLVDLGGDVEAHQRESLHELGTLAVPGEGATSGMGDFGSAEVVQAEAGGDSGRRRGEAPDQ